MTHDSPPWQPAGTVYGCLLNFRAEYAQWAPQMHQPPYKAPPQAPVLYVKTANTFNPDGGTVAVPAGAEGVEAGATLGLVMGEQGPVACALLNDFSLPHSSYFRPPVKFRCRDGFLGTPVQTVPLADLGGLSALAGLQLQVLVNGVLCQTVDLSQLVRPAAALLTDVGEFMGLRAGDVLMLGTDIGAEGRRPRLQAGDTVEIRTPGFAPLRHTLITETLA